VLLGAALALVIVLPHPVWRYGARFGITAAHEAGHAFSALLLTGTLSRIKLRHDTSGVTYSQIGTGIRGVLVGMSGYPAPALLGLVGVYVTCIGYSAEWLLIMPMLAIIEGVIWVRSLFGWLIIVLGTAALAALWRYGPADLNQVATLFLSFTFLFGSLRDSLNITEHRQPDSDVDTTARLLHLPVSFMGFWLVATIVAALAAASVLLFWHF